MDHLIWRAKPFLLSVEVSLMRLRAKQMRFAHRIYSHAGDFLLLFEAHRERHQDKIEVARLSLKSLDLTPKAILQSVTLMDGAKNRTEKCSHDFASDNVCHFKHLYDFKLCADSLLFELRGVV